MNQIVNLNDFKEKNYEEINEFLMNKNSNGEFINSPKFLEYHPKTRFIDDSIIVINTKTNKIKCLFMAATRENENDVITSHPGTTFSGPVFGKIKRIEEVEEIINLIISYYSKKYKTIEIKMPPPFYQNQYMQEIDYFLLKNKFKYSFNALTNFIDLHYVNGTENELFSLYDQKRRNQVRKSLKDCLYIVEKKEIIDKELWGKMNSKINKKFQSNLTHSYEEIVEIKKLFPENVEFYIATRTDGEYGAFAVVFKFKNVFHTQYLDLNYEYSKEYPNLLMIHELISKACNENFKYFSFGASTENKGNDINLGLYNYKMGYGSGTAMMPVYTKKEEWERLFYINVNNNIQLKLISFNEINVFFELIQKNKEYLKVFMPRISENNDLETTEKVISIFYKQLYENNGFRTGIYYNNQLIGVAGLKYIDWINKSTEIMYWIDKDFSKKGITKKVVEKIIEVSFNSLNLNKIILKTNVNNIGSIKIAEKCLFKLEGVLIKDELLDNGYSDTKVYGLINSGGNFKEGEKKWKV